MRAYVTCINVVKEYSWCAQYIFAAVEQYAASCIYSWCAQYIFGAVEQYAATSGFTADKQASR